MIAKLPLPFFLVAIFALGACDCSTSQRVGRDTGITPGGDADVVDTGFPQRDTGSCEPAPEGTPETCIDGIDNNCDGLFDCSDRGCSGVGPCPVCGQVDTALGAPLSLPDGSGAGDCVTDADCPGVQRCYEFDGGIFGGETSECREPYLSTLDFVGFEAGRRFEAVSDIVSVCVVMEHSWVRDLQMDLQAPDGRVFHLQEFAGREGGEVYMGVADDCDTSESPSPGTGATYCWTPTATRPAMFEFADAGGLPTVTDCNGGSADQLPAGEYDASDDWTMLIGAPLNGAWSLAVTDLWGADNGYIFEWSITFAAGAVEDCGSPLI
ncbi:MAG: hypothetical protein ACI9KE_002885 [Polyangiales bacterium]